MKVFLDGAAGAILVHDLSNKKSEDVSHIMMCKCLLLNTQNLSHWLALIDGKDSTENGRQNLIADIESCPIPVLTVGCKLDLVPHRGPLAYDRLRKLRIGETALI